MWPTELQALNYISRFFHDLGLFVPYLGSILKDVLLMMLSPLLWVFNFFKAFVEYDWLNPRNPPLTEQWATTTAPLFDAISWFGVITSVVGVVLGVMVLFWAITYFASKI